MLNYISILLTIIISILIIAVGIGFIVVCVILTDIIREWRNKK